MTDRLPPSLASWTGALAALTPALTVALGPLLRGIDELVTGRAPRPAADGEPDGYDGLTRLGPPHRLLASQWLLADELPEEFLRRAVQRELLHLSPARRDGRPRGRVVVAADTGPSNAGAARLVQLAALVVLNRRAEGHGSELRLRIPGAGVDAAGPLAEILPLWLRSRSPEDPGPEELAAAAAPDAEHADDESWILTSEPVGARLPGRRRVLTAADAAWDADGATTVRISIDGSRRELPLPPGPIAVSALRGRQFRTSPRPAADRAAAASTRVSLPGFTGETPHLMARTPDPKVIATLNVTAAEPRWKAHGFPAAVLAASFLGRRMVAVLADRQITVGTVGQDLRTADEVAVPVRAVGLTDALLAEAVAEPPGPVFHHDGDFLVRLAHRWWSLNRDGASPTPYTAVVPGGPAGAVPPIRITVDSAEARNRRLFHMDHVAIDYGSGTWLVRSPRNRWIIRLPAGDRAFGLAQRPDGPLLLSFAEEGLIRSTDPAGARTVVTEWDDAGLLPAVHPTRPLVAGIRDDRLEVTDVALGRRVLTRGVGL